MTATSSDIDLLARTIWGEDRGGGEAGMTAVAWVIRNRVNHPGWWGHDIYSVCKCRLQFDCWNEGDPNHGKLLAVTESDPVFGLALRVAAGVLSGIIADPTNGATQYYAKTITAPYWARGRAPTADIGNQLYFA
jgi:N-acetylmuramoyl-L-alanine amidase